MTDENERYQDKRADGEGSGTLFAGDVRKRRGEENKTGGKRWRTLIALVVLCGFAVGGYFASKEWKPAPVENPSTTPVPGSESFLLVDKERADLKSITVKSDTQDYIIDYDGTNFSVRGLPGFNLDQTKAGNLATSCTYLYAYNIEESSSDLAAYGLASPRATVTAEYTDGTSTTFLLGDPAPSGSRSYLKTADKTNIYTVYSSTGDRFTATLGSLHLIPSWTIAQEDITRVNLIRPDGTTVETEQFTAALGISTVRLSQPFIYEADSEDIAALYSSITELKATSFEADPVAGTLSLYGLDKPRYTLNIYGKADEPVQEPTPVPTLAGSILDMSATPAPTVEPTSVPLPGGAGVRQGEKRLLSLEIGNDKNDTQTYVRIDSRSVYLMDKTSLDFLKAATAAELVDRFANIINIMKIDGFKIKGMGIDESFAIERVPSLDENGTQKLDGAGKPATNDNFTINTQPADDTTFRKLYQIIIGTRVDGLIPEGKTPAANISPELTVAYTLNVPNDLGLMKETVEYLPYDSDNYAVRRNGVTMFYILKSRVHMIIDSINDYHAGTFDPKKYGV